MRGFRRTLAMGLGLITLVVTTSCVSNSEAGCALGFVRDGTTYYPYEATEPIDQGSSLGQVSTLDCDDGSGSGGDPELWEAVAIPGIDPDLAFLVPAESTSIVFAPGPPDGSEVSPEVKELLADVG